MRERQLSDSEKGETMKIRKPEYYDRFRCIAGACQDSCCIGWEIDIDEEKAAYYKTVQGKLGERMKQQIDWEEGHFILQGKEERCPFLNQEKLCDLILELGEDSLCEICREHPRFYDWFDTLTEVGLGLCCEAAGRLILEQKEPVCFVEEDDKEKAQESKENNKENSEENNEESSEAQELSELLFESRETAFQILQNRNVSIWQRLGRLLDFSRELQEMLDFGIAEEIEETNTFYRGDWEGEEPEGKREESYPGILRLCRSLEALDESWEERLKVLEQMAADPAEISRLELALNQSVSGRDYEYEQLAVYFVYRYFMKCRFDGAVYPKAALAVFCLFLIRLLDLECFWRTGALTREDRVQNAKFCSKQIEYSEENLDLLEACFLKYEG